MQGHYIPTQLATGYSQIILQSGSNGKSEDVTINYGMIDWEVDEMKTPQSTMEMLIDKSMR